jgi:hypothetical protein
MSASQRVAGLAGYEACKLPEPLPIVTSQPVGVPPPKECRGGQDGNVVPRLVTGNQIEPGH